MRGEEEALREEERARQLHTWSFSELQKESRVFSDEGLVTAYDFNVSFWTRALSSP